MTRNSRLVVLFVSVPILTFALLGGYLRNTLAQEDVYRHLQIFEDVVTLISENYVEIVEYDELMQGAMRGLSAGLDGKSSYLTKQEVTLFEQDIPLPEGQTGLTLTNEYYPRVVAAKDGTPAEIAGLMPGDYVRNINGESTRNISLLSATRLLRGEPGSKVSLTILRGNAMEPHTVELTFTIAEASEMLTKMVSPGVGYLRIPTFEQTNPSEAASTIDTLMMTGTESLIIDLRGTAEGALKTGYEIAELFVPAGIMSIRESRGESREVISVDKDGRYLALRLVILINSGTSGPAELFAAALATNQRATLIGTQSQGQTADQRLVKLPDGSGLWLSWTHYLTPDGEPIHGHGLEPFIIAEEPFVEFGSNPPDDDQGLAKALDYLENGPAS
ncbi:MAG: S41 family peptidase [Acidobacteriota bacterium]|nr:S41 family peptidase [Acidobacteriota bacterium]